MSINRQITSRRGSARRGHPGWRAESRFLVPGHRRGARVGPGRGRRVGGLPRLLPGGRSGAWRRRPRWDRAGGSGPRAGGVRSRAGGGGGAPGAGQGGDPGRRGHRAGAVRAQCRCGQGDGVHHQGDDRPPGPGAARRTEGGDHRRGAAPGRRGVAAAAEGRAPDRPPAPPRPAAEERQRRRGGAGRGRRRQRGGVRPADEPEGRRPPAQRDPLRDPLRTGPSRAPDQRSRPGPPLGGGHAPGRLPLAGRHQVRSNPRWTVVASSICLHEPAARLLPVDGRGQDRLHQPGRTLPGRLGQPRRPPPGRGRARVPQRLRRRPGAVRARLLQVRPGPPGRAAASRCRSPPVVRPSSRPPPPPTPWSAWTSSTRSA